MCDARRNFEEENAPHLGSEYLIVIKQRRSLSRGFTLIEMLVVLTIVVILLAIGVPNMTNLFQTNRLATTTNELVGALSLARSEAIRRGVRVVLLSDSGTRDWTSGWKMFVDLDGDGTQDAGEDSIRVGTATAAATIVASTGLVAIAFDSFGRAAGGLFAVCDSENVTTGGHARAVVVNAAGRIRVSGDRNQQPANDAGTAITSCSNPS